MPDLPEAARAVEAALRDEAEALRAALQAAVDANLDGGRLQTRTGTLKASVIAGLDPVDEGIAATVESLGVPYAAIQEWGGTTAAHDIVPVKARALAFAGAGGGTTFAQRVHHPGSVIPARAPFGAALEALADEIGGRLKAAVVAALGAT